MTSVEGMWAFLSGSAENPNDMRDGGILVLETGRVFGGDSAMAYVGHFETSGNKLVAKVNSWTWNSGFAESGIENVFGMTGKINLNVVFEGERYSEDELRGVIYAEENPDTKLAAILKKIAELP